MTGMPASTPGLTLATKVTLVRLLCVPVFALMLVYYLGSIAAGAPDHRLRYAALALFVLVAATDALDGYLARSRNEITALGKALDPLADKSLLLSALILLTRPSLAGLEPHIPVWFTGLVISRDVVLIGGYFLVHHFTGHVVVHPRASGKIATVLQMILVVLVLLGVRDAFFQPFALLAGAVTGLSFLHYMIDGSRQLGRTPHTPSRS